MQEDGQKYMYKEAGFKLHSIGRETYEVIKESLQQLVVTDQLKMFLFAMETM